MAGLRRRPGDSRCIVFILLTSVFLDGAVLPVSSEITSKRHRRLTRLNAQISDSSTICSSLEKLVAQLNLDEQLSQPCSAELADRRNRRTRSRCKGLYRWPQQVLAPTPPAGAITELGKANWTPRNRFPPEALAQIEVLNQQISRVALASWLPSLEQALDASEKRDKESQTRIADLGQPAERGTGAAGAGTVALSFRVLRSAARTSSATGTDVRIVGDRFVFSVRSVLLTPDRR